MMAAELASSPARLRWWAPAEEDRWPVAILVLVPTLLFVVPSLLGHPPIAGDNLIQNFPLRVLSGKILATGHLPLWNTGSFSGTPLLGGMNAGSLYPGSVIFAFLPATFAWVLNMIACYLAAGVGLYLLVRRLGAAPLPALLGAISYAYMGMMVGQMVHLGVIQGLGWMPWVVLSILLIAERIRRPDDSTWRVRLIDAGWPLLGLVVLSALIFLSGEPRAMVELEIVGLLTTIYAAVVTDGARRSRSLAALALPAIAALWGALVAAVQLVPGFGFITLSQRSHLSSDFFGSGSLSLNKTILLGIPDLFGGTGLFHQPTYFTDYNLPEVTGYIGMIGLAAIVAGALRLVDARRRSAPRHLYLALAFVVTGLIFAWGEFTPIIHLMGQIPLLNKTRLQSRNLAVFDLGGAMLVAWFCDRLLLGDAAGASLRGWRRTIVALPIAATAVVAALALIAPSWLERSLGVDANVAVEGHYLAPWIAIELCLALAALWLIFDGPRLHSSRRRLALSSLVIIDCVLFLLAATTGLTAGNVPVQPSRAVAVSVLGTQGRYALVDPALQSYDQFIRLGQPNTNVFTGLPSVQGYGSLVAEPYGDATGTHPQNGMDACQLARGRFDQLRLSSIVIISYELAPKISAAGSTAPRGSPPPVIPCPGMPDHSRSVVRRMYFGQSLEVSQLFFAASSDAVTSDPRFRSDLRVSLIGATGSAVPADGVVRPTAKGWEIRLQHPAAAVGLLLRGAVGKVSDQSLLTSASGDIYSLNGSFQDALDGGPWRQVSTVGNLSVFHRTIPVPGPLWFGRDAGRNAKVHSSTTNLGGTETDVVSLSTAGTLYRSVSALPGWRAEISASSGGPSKELVVRSADLIQSVRLPAGSWRIVFTYHAPHITAGDLMSMVGTALLLAAGTALLLADRRRRRPASAPGGNLRR